ncbi:MAG: hypothetical protein M1831_007476 [Alyxoria varia]|nr:MAG: hypothetical protein M1831_007476 [Alyxoria varia]
MGTTSQQRSLIAQDSVLIVVAVAAVVLRFWSRKLSRSGYWWDDWSSIVTLAFVLCFMIYAALLTLPGVAGLGRHAADNPNGATGYMYYLYFLLLVYNGSLALFKYTFLLLYLRIFPTYWLKASIWAAIGVVSAWVVSIEFVLIFQCRPARGAWDKTLNAKCIDTKALYAAQSVPTIVFDVVILMMPMPLVWRLQSNWKAKVGVTSMFLMGGLVTIISIIRFYYALNSDYSDATYNLFSLSAWSEAEPPVGLVSACLPTYGPLIRRLTGKIRSSVPGQGYSGSGSKVLDGSGPQQMPGGATKSWVTGNNNDQFVPLGDGDGDSQIALTDRRRDIARPGDDEEEGIRVRRDIHVTEDPRIVSQHQDFDMGLQR